MNRESLALMTFIGSVVSVFGVRLIYQCACGFSRRTANDVFPFLFKVDIEALYGTFHPEAEEDFRHRLQPKEFRRVQWKRFHLAMHYCYVLSHNARVLQSWVRYERNQSWNGMSPSLQRTVTNLRAACVQCRLSTFVIRTRLRWWLVRSALMPFIALPSFRILLPLGSADMISYYEKMRSLAELFSLAYGQEFHQKLARTL
jgi:hypothetical protein